ncbi:MAG TPA: thioredoxin family protein [Chitinophagaceae bacterium]|nr:thioredoxin family protein [Chitinophagaceae bacterium]
MKKIVFCVMLVIAAQAGFSQDLSKFNLYHPSDNAEKEIKEAAKLAKQQNKHVLVQIGGNWCIWCARFHDFISTDKSIDSLVKANYIVYHLNWSKENRNTALLAKYGFPQRFGFPVFLILDGSGKLLHTQNSSYLEDGNKSYKKEVVMGFLSDWSHAALDPDQYKDQ